MENTILPKWLVAGLGGLLVIFVALLVVQKASELNTIFKNQKPVNTISVSGEGKVTVTPNLASVTIGVFSQGSSVSDLKNQNNDKINKVITFIKSLGIDAKDIMTSQYDLQPQYNSQTGLQTVTGYQLNQTVTVKVRGVDKDTSVLDKIVEGSVNNGANQVYGVGLSIDNPDSLQQQAQEKAIAAAKVKAQALAQAAGLTLGKVVSVSESGGGYPGPIAYNVSSSFAPMADLKSVAPDIQTGSQDITETMTVVFEVK